MPIRAQLVAHNPNESVGGGGCVCSPSKCEDCKAPFLVFPASETDSNLSPHVVLSVHCAKAGVALARKSKPLASGQSDVIEGTVEPDDEGLAL